MTNPFESDEWVEVSDENGKKSAMRHLGTVRFAGKTYFVLGAVREGDEGEVAEGALMLVRQDQTPDGAQEYVLANDANEIEQVVGRFVMDSLLEEMAAPQEEEQTWPCGQNHRPGEFCCCGMSEYLQ